MQQKLTMSKSEINSEDIKKKPKKTTTGGIAQTPKRSKSDALPGRASPDKNASPATRIHTI